MASDEVTDLNTGQLIYPGFQRGPGLHNASAYQVSGKPFFTGSVAVGTTPVFISFPAVSIWVNIVNEGAAEPIHVGLTRNGVKSGGTNNFMYVQSTSGSWNQTGQMSLKTTGVWIKTPANNTKVSVVASLTQIANKLEASEGPNWSGSSGVG